MTKPPFTISNVILQYVISITEKISKISIYSNLDKLPILSKKE